MITIYLVGLLFVFTFYLACMVTGWPEAAWKELDMNSYRERMQVFAIPLVLLSILWPVVTLLILSAVVKIALNKYRSKR